MTVASKYNRIAPVYELIDLPLELSVFRRWRRDALSGLNGKVLEVGIGTGKNLKYYPNHCSVVGIDYSEKMLEKARKKAAGMKNVTLLLMDAEHLEFPDNSFDYIVTTFVLSSVPDPVRALSEMRRVLKPSGELIALEYVHSRNRALALLENLINPVVCSLTGDNINRKTIENFKLAGFTITAVKNLIFKNFFKNIRAKQ